MGSVTLSCFKVSPARLCHLQVVLQVEMNVERVLVRAIEPHRHSHLTSDMTRSGSFLQACESEDDGVLLQVVGWCQ